MCRIEERVYISKDGKRSVFEDTFPCDKSSRGKLCSKVKRRTTEYFPKAQNIARDDAPSPASNNPPTPPVGAGSYFVEQRRPSVVGARPSTRDGERVIKPEIIIEFGSHKGNKGKKYQPQVSVPAKKYKRSSLGGSSIASNEGPLDALGSDASYPIPTGFPDAPVPQIDPFGQSPGYTTRHAVPQSHHRHMSSASSIGTSSQPPSLYATSDPESPSGRQAPRYPPTIVHNPLPGGAPSSPTASRAAAPTPVTSGYRTTTVVPQVSSRDNLGPDGLTPLDYSDFIDHSASSVASSGRAAAPEITDRAADRERRRKHKEEEKKRQEEADRRIAEELAKQEEVKQVRFELGRAEDRARQRGENKIAESEKRRALEREDARRRRKDQDERTEKVEKTEKPERVSTAKKPEREKTKPPTNDFNIRPRHSRRPSMTQADIDERNRLLLETKAQMARELEATEQREREERSAQLRQQQPASDYWDPRGGDRYAIPNNGPGVGRRGSVSGRRPSLSGNAPPMGLGRSNSNRRVSIIQPVPPANMQPAPPAFPQPQYSTRPTNSHFQNPQPAYSSGSYAPNTRPPSARHSSYQQENPFALPPTRTSNTSQDNPFAQPSTRPIHPSSSHENPFAQQSSVLYSPPESAREPFDTRDLRETLPRTNSHRNQPPTLRTRGEEQFVDRSGEDRARGHGRAQQATRTMGMAVGYEDDYQDDSSSEEDVNKLAGHGARLGRTQGGRRRN